MVPRRLKRLEAGERVSQWEWLGTLLRFGQVTVPTLLFVGVLGYVFLASPLTAVDHIQIDGGDETVRQALSTRLDDFLNQPVGKWFSRRNFFLFPEQAVRDLALQNFPHIRSIQIEKRFPQTISIQLETRDRFVVVCSSGPCLALDEEGRVVSNEDALDDSWQRLRLIDRSGLPFDVSQPILSPEFIGFLDQLPERLHTQTGLTLQGDWETPARFSETVDVTTSEGWRLRLDQKTADDTTLLSLRVFLEKQVKSPADRARLEYVDARTAGRLYYRLQGDDAAILTPATSATTSPTATPIATPTTTAAKKKK